MEYMPSLWETGPVGLLQAAERRARRPTQRISVQAVTAIYVCCWNYAREATFLPYLFTPYLTPWSRVLLEKLTGFRLVKKFPAFYATRRFIIAFTSAPPPVPILSQIKCPGPRLSLQMIRNRIRFYGEELLAPRPTPNLEDHPLSAVRHCLFIFAATLHIGGRSSIRNLRTRHAVVTGTHLSRPGSYTCITAE